MSIREVNAVAITDAVEELCIRANTQLPPDVKQALDNAHAAEPWPLARQTLELLQKYQIAVLVSKDSGMRGGVAEKVQAAKVMGIPVILIAPPAEATMTLPEMQKALLACAEKERKQI